MTTRRPTHPIGEEGRQIDPDEGNTFWDKLYDLEDTVAWILLAIVSYPIAKIMGFFYDDVVKTEDKKNE